MGAFVVDVVDFKKCGKGKPVRSRPQGQGHNRRCRHHKTAAKNMRQANRAIGTGRDAIAAIAGRLAGRTINRADNLEGA